MDGDDFDLYSHAPEMETFPGLDLYGGILQDNSDGLFGGSGSGSALPPYRPPRASGGEVRVGAAAPHVRQLLFGGSTSAAASRGCGSGAGNGVCQRANSVVAAPGRRPQLNNIAGHRTSSHGAPCLPAPRAARAPRAPRNAVCGQASNSGFPFYTDETMKDEEEELASSGGPTEGDHGPIFEEEVGDGGSSSEDEIISIWRNNLVQQQKLIVQLVPILGKWYVVDAGYPNRPGYLAPYRCIRYHVEQWQNGPPPQGMKEVFNHAHAKVRNVVERTFGVLKMKFRILLNMQRFPENKQTRIIVACMALHNFIRESRIADREFEACDNDENYNPMPSFSPSTWPEDEPLIEDVNMNAFRDELALALFHGV